MTLRVWRLAAVCSMLSLALAARASAQDAVVDSRTDVSEAEVVRLWIGAAPHASGDAEADTPLIRAYLPDPDVANGAGIVVCPGGGYGVLATDHEGTQVARWLNSIGMAGFVLRYRHAPDYRHPVPLLDAQRAIRLVRARAARFRVDPERIGVMGFSAGGHLASTAATHFDRGQPDADDPVQRQSCRPDFAVLCYPVISMQSDFTHRGSVRNLLGENPAPELLKSLSNETQVTEDTPPTFLFHTSEDQAVPVQNSLAFYAALVEAGVPAELHCYQQGPHGVGLAIADPVVTTWKRRLRDWLRTSGFLSRVERAAVSGSVTVDGQPLRWGMIRFQPRGNPQAPVAAAMVSRGQYSVPQWRGVTVGPNAVAIYDLGDVRSEPTVTDAERIDPLGKLAVEVTSEGTNAFNFSLTR